MGENRHRHTVWMDDAVWDQVESHYQADNCSTKNEYIEKAVRFYSGYLDTESADVYLPQVLASVLEGKLNAFGKWMGHLLFKIRLFRILLCNGNSPELLMWGRILVCLIIILEYCLIIIAG